MLIETIELDNGCASGLSFQMQKVPLIVIRAEKGFVMCGYLDMAAAGAIGDAAAKVKGVKTFDEVLQAPVIEVTEQAAHLGIKTGVSGKEALELMF